MIKVTDKEKDLTLALFDAYLKVVEDTSYLHAILSEVYPDWQEEYVKLKQISQERGVTLERKLDVDVSVFRWYLSRNYIPAAHDFFTKLQKIFSEPPPQD